MKWGFSLVPIGDLVSSVSKWNPSKHKTNELFTYIDISSINRETKQVEETVQILTHTAPSRARQIVKAGDVLVSTVRPNLNAVTYLDNQFDGATASTGFTVLRAKPQKLNACYLYYWVCSPYFIQNMVRKSTGATYPAVSDSIIKESALPLPPLEEQQRIAAILDKADDIRRKRKQAIALTEELLRSTFLDMFGDPVTNPKGWEVDYLGKHILHANNGLSRRRKTFQNEGEIVLRLQDIKVGYIDLCQPNRILLDENEKKRYLLKLNDLVFIRVNGNKDYVGRCAVYKGFDESVYHNDHIIRIQTSENITSEYLAFIFNHPSGKKIIQNQVKTSAGQYTISQKGIESIQLPIPPRQLQDDFIKVSIFLKETNNHNRIYLMQSQNLFNSLLQKAFKGEL